MPHSALKVGLGFGQAIPAFGMSLFYVYILGDGISFDAPDDPSVTSFMWVDFFTIVITILGLVFLCKPIDCMAYTFFTANPLNIAGLVVYIFFSNQYFYVPLIAALCKITSLIFGIFLWRKIKEDALRPQFLYPIYAAQPIYAQSPDQYPNYTSLPYEPFTETPNSPIQEEGNSPFWSSKKGSTSTNSKI